MKLITLFIFMLSLFHASDGAVAKNARTQMTAQPNWNMAIANLSADAGKDFPYADYSFTLLPGKFIPGAICAAQVLKRVKTKPDNKTIPLLGTAEWIGCHTVSAPIDDKNKATGSINNSDLPPQQPANVAFKWTPRGDGGALLRVDTNYTMEMGKLYVSFPSFPRRELQHRDDGIDYFLYQRGTFNISSDNIVTGEVYTGAPNLTTAVDFIMFCQGADYCGS